MPLAVLGYLTGNGAICCHVYTVDITPERIAEIHEACRILFQSGLNYLNGCNEVEQKVPQSPERDNLLLFIRESKRGIIKPYESRTKEE